MSGFLELFSRYDVLGAFLVNIELTLWSALFSLILGVILVVMRISPISSLRAVAGAYVELFKNLPLTIIMVFMVLGAYAQLKLSFSDTFTTNFFWLAVTGLSLYTARSCANLCVRASTPCRLARPRPHERWAWASCSPPPRSFCRRPSEAPWHRSATR